jgi:hypothetical protein
MTHSRALSRLSAQNARTLAFRPAKQRFGCIDAAFFEFLRILARKLVSRLDRAVECLWNWQPSVFTIAPQVINDKCPAAFKA